MPKCVFHLSPDCQCSYKTGVLTLVWDGTWHTVEAFEFPAAPNDLYDAVVVQLRVEWHVDTLEFGTELGQGGDGSRSQTGDARDV